jgi:hypothetical protein
MATDRPVPVPREAKRQPWPWGEHVLCIGTDGSAVDADGAVSMQAFVDPGTIEAQAGREIWLQLDGNRMVILTETDQDHPNGLWFSPLSIVREKIVTAVEQERALIESGTLYPLRTVSVINVGGRKLARRAWSWRTRNGGPIETEFIDEDYLDWEVYVATHWPRTPKPREVALS